MRDSSYRSERPNFSNKFSKLIFHSIFTMKGVKEKKSGRSLLLANWTIDFCLLSLKNVCWQSGKKQTFSISDELLFPYLFVLVRGDRDELGLLEHVRPECGVGQLQDVIGPYKVKPWLVLVHRVQDRLKKY